MTEEQDDLPEEPMEPELDEDEGGPKLKESLERVPMRIAIFFTGVGDDGESRELDEVIEGVIEDAEKRGLFYVWGASDEIPEKEVAVGSPLWQAVTGREF